MNENCHPYNLDLEEKENPKITYTDMTKSQDGMNTLNRYFYIYLVY